MAKIKVITDSTAGITVEEAKKYGIEILPLFIEMEGKTYNSLTDLTNNEFLEKMSHSPSLPKSSQPPLGMFIEAYKKATQEGYQVLSFHLTEHLSGTVNTARQAAKLVEGEIDVVDTGYIARAQAFQVLQAAQMAQENKHSLKEIQKKVEEIRLKTRLYIVVVTLENLIKGGRVGKMQGIIGNLLNVKLIANLAEGVLREEAKVRSTKKAIAYLSDLIRDETNQIVRLEIMHAGGLTSSLALKANIKEHINEQNVPLFDADPIITTHTGSGAFAIMYYTE